MLRTSAVLGFVLLSACSSGSSSSSSDCDAIAQAIRDAAVKPRLPNYPNGYDGNGDGKPDAIGICTSTDPTIVKDFGNACAMLKACNGSTQP